MDTTNNGYMPNTWISAWGEEMYHDIKILAAEEYRGGIFMNILQDCQLFYMEIKINMHLIC